MLSGSLLYPELPESYVHLAENGSGTSTGGGAEIWQLPPEQMSRFDQGWLLSELVCSEDWANWKMHPHGVEFVYRRQHDWPSFNAMKAWPNTALQRTSSVSG